MNNNGEPDAGDVDAFVAALRDEFQYFLDFDIPATDNGDMYIEPIVAGQFEECLGKLCRNGIVDFDDIPRFVEIMAPLIGINELQVALLKFPELASFASAIPEPGNATLAIIGLVGTIGTLRRHFHAKAALYFTSRFYARRATGGDRHHCRARGAIAAGHSGRPRGGPPHPVHESIAPDRLGDPKLRFGPSAVSTW